MASSSVSIQHGTTALQYFMGSLIVGNKCYWKTAVSEYYSTNINRVEGPIVYSVEGKGTIRPLNNNLKNILKYL